MEGPIINKMMVRKSREIRRIQKEAKARYQKGRTDQAKVRIRKIVELRKNNPVVDLTDVVAGAKENNQTKYNNVLEAARAVQIFGMSGSGFPVESKLETVRNAKAKVKYCIINAVECEPSLLQDEWLLRNKSQWIQKGAEYLSQLIPFQRIVVAHKLKVDLAQNNKKVEFCQVPDRYPMGEEHILISQVLHQTIEKSQVPANLGILIINVQTVIALAEAMEGVYPEHSKYITVADLRSGQAAIVRVKTGMSVMEILKKVMPNTPKGYVYVGGGALFGRIASEKTTVDEHTGFIGYGDAVPFVENAKCKKCGGCRRKCPMGISLDKMIRTLEQNPNADISSFGLQNCIECGTCTYVCGAGRNNMEFIHKRKEMAGWKA